MGIYQPFSFLQVGWTHRRLILRLAWRKIEARYRGSTLGLLWILISPLLMLCIYTFVFSVVFKARWSLPGGGEAQFALLLFSGIILYTIFSECANEAPGLMLAHQTYIKQVRFPIEIFAWVSLAASLFNFAVSTLILVLFYLVVQGQPPLSCLYLPVMLCPVLLLTLGVTWIISSVGVFLRDISQLVGVMTTALLFLSPIFYPASRIPESLRSYYYLNPFASLLEMSKGSLFYARPPDWETLAVIFVAAWAVAWIGYVWFMRTKKGFADVL